MSSKYYAYKIYKDINPNSLTYGKYKYERYEAGDEECTAKYSPNWVLIKQACSNISTGISEVVDRTRESFNVQKYIDQNPNSPTYNTYLYKLVGKCAAIIDREPNWILVPEKTGASAKNNIYDPELIPGEDRYWINTYIDTNSNSSTYNTYKYELDSSKNVNEYEFKADQLNFNEDYTEHQLDIPITSTYNDAFKDYIVESNTGSSWITIINTDETFSIKLNSNQ